MNDNTAHISYLNALQIDTTEIMDTASAAYFIGIISSDSLNAKSYRLSKETLRSVSVQAGSSDGVPVFLNHKAFTSLPAGRSVSAVLTDNRVRTRFFIQRGLKDICSDDVIARLRAGTLRDLSIGFSGGEFICDICGEPMHTHLFNRADKNGHVLGQTLPDGRLVTATVHGDITLMEFSVVGIGADPDAKILTQLKEKPLESEPSSSAVSLAFLSHIAEYHNISYETLSQELNSHLVKDEAKATLLPEEPNTTGGNKIMATHKSVTDVLREENEALLEKNQALTQQLSEVISQEHYDALESELAETKATLEKRDATIQEMERLSKVGQFALSCERESVEKGYIAMRGTSIRGHDDPELISLRSELANEDDLRVLKDKAKSYWRQARQYPHRDGIAIPSGTVGDNTSTLTRLGKRTNQL